MEIAATGLPGLGAMTNVAAAPEGGDAFAAALGAVGLEETAVSPDGGPALVLPTVPTATAQAPLLTSAIAQPVPEEPAPDELATEAVALAPSEPPVDSAAVETPQPKDPALATPPLRGGKAAPKSKQAPAQGVPTTTVGAKPAEAAEPTKIAKADREVAGDTVKVTDELAPEQPDDGLAAPLADASLTPTVPVPHDAAKVHSATPQPGKADDSMLQVEPRSNQRAHPALANAVASTGGEGSAEPVGESFAQQVSNQAPDRPQSQLGATPLPGQTPAVAAQPGGLAATAAAQHPTLSFRADKVAREMGLEIARHVKAGGSDELVIRLDPAELGRINIRMSVNEHGHLRAVVAADAPAVIDAIRNDIPELSRALEQAGVRTDGQSFRFDRGGSDAGGQWQQRYQQQAGTRHADSGSFAGLEDEPAYRPLATNGRINMMA